MEQKEKSKKKNSIDQISKDLIDKDSIFHFLFGIGLGFFLRIFIDDFILAFIIGIVLIPLIEFITHRIFIGYTTLLSKNALGDFTLAVIGLILILVLFQHFQ